MKSNRDLLQGLTILNTVLLFTCTEHSYSVSQSSSARMLTRRRRVTHRRVLGTLCLRRTGWYPTERDIEYRIGL
uniref:RxLR effector candidate protein n=1 Tax=Hyaloperonospora arabidopsidis (strain Emoy2) TaxID=559515 RepID=M4B4E6_HYAAE